MRNLLVFLAITTSAAAKYGNQLCLRVHCALHHPLASDQQSGQEAAPTDEVTIGYQNYRGNQ